MSDPRQGLNIARALAPEFYSGEQSLRRDRQTVLGKHWQLLGDCGQLSANGGQLETSLAGIPVWLLEDESGNYRILHNVCRHRAGPLCVEGHGQRRRLRCRYHGWSYGLDGGLLSAPEMEQAEDFDLASIALPEANVAVWQGLLFGSLQPTVPIEQWLDGISERLGDLALDQLQFHSREHYDIDCNWKVYIDNFLEGYHIPHIHPELNRLLDYRAYHVELDRWYSLQHSALDNDDGPYGNGEALYYFLFPNTMLNIVPGRLQTNQVIPLSSNRCRVVFEYYYLAQDRDQVAAECASKTDQDQQFSDLVQRQDIDICEAVQRGLESGSYQAGRLNPLRENGLFHFHELLREAYQQAAEL